MHVATARNWVQVLAYGAPHLMNTIFTVVAVIYIPAVYAREQGMSLETIGVALLAARLFDAFIDPAIGSLSDRTPARWGRRKTWLALSVPAIVGSTFLLFTPAASVGPIYLCVTLLVWYLAYSAFTIPYYAWGAEIATGYSERGTLIGVRELCALAGFCALQIYLLSQGSGGRVAADEVLRVAAYAVAIVLPLAAMLAIVLVPSQGARHVAGTAALGGHFRAMWESLRDNGPYRRIIVCHTVLVLATNMYGTVLVFLIEDVLQLENFTNQMVVMLAMVAALTAPLSIWLSARIGKHLVLMIAHFLYAAAFVYLLFVPPRSEAYLFPAIVVLGSCWGMMLTTPAAIVSDTADYFALKTRKWQPGILLSGYVFTLKLAVAVGSFIALTLVDLSGFRPGEPHDAGQILAFKTVALVIPAVLLIIAGAMLYRHPITAQRHAMIRKRLEQRALRMSGGSVEVA